MELDKELKQDLMKRIREGKPIPVSYKSLLFPPEERQQEYELVYGCKERKEDVLSVTMSVPFQVVKQFGKSKEGEWENKLIFGDNIQALKFMLKDPEIKEKIKLIYIDPPFGTGELYDAAGIPAYSAALQGAAFVEFLRKRLILLRELMADDGSIYVRIDYHFGHYVKIIMDEIFGKNNFRNEVVVSRGRNIAGARGGKLEVDNDSVLWYSKSSNFIFNDEDVKVQRPVSEIKWTSFLMAGDRYPRERAFLGKVLAPPQGQHFSLIQEKVDRLLKEYYLRLRCRSCGIRYYYGKSDEELFKEMKQKEHRFKFYDLKADTKFYATVKIDKCFDCGGEKFAVDYLGSSEKKISNIWLDIESYSRITSYPTENSEQLLERVIRASCEDGDIVLDAFAGSGTTGAVAEKLGRRWIMVDSSKLAIYTMIKRLHNLRKEIGNKGKPVKPKPFVLCNAGLYKDHCFILSIGEEQYKKFAMELFQVEPKKFEINGLEMDGVLFNCPVKVFSQKGYLTEEYVDELHDTVGEQIKGRMFLIAPASRVYFLQDYIEKGGLRYYVLRIPYSVIDELHKQKFTRPMQPASSGNINQLIEQVGFDFVHPPNVKAEYYKRKPKDKIIEEELVIEIKEFEAVQRSKEPIEFKDPKDALSMVLIDRNYNGKYFNMSDYFFKDQIEKEGWKVKILNTRTGNSVMIIYLDVLGNERIEVKSIKDFKKKE